MDQDLNELKHEYYHHTDNGHYYTKMILKFLAETEMTWGENLIDPYHHSSKGAP